MSARALLWVADLKALTLSERGILQKLARHAHQDGSSAYPSLQTIATWADLQPRNVRMVLNRLLARKLITVEGSNGRKGGRGRATTYRVAIPDEYDPRRWREAHVHAWQDAHTSLPAKTAQCAGTKEDDGQGQPAADKERRQKPAHSGAGKAAKIDTKRRHSIAAQAEAEAVLSKNNRSALPRRPQGGREVGAAASETNAARPYGEAIWRSPDLDAHHALERKAMGLMRAMHPHMSETAARRELYALKINFDCRPWGPVITALVRCSELPLLPVDRLRWLNRYAACARAEANHPGSGSRQ